MPRINTFKSGVYFLVCSRRLKVHKFQNFKCLDFLSEMNITILLWLTTCEPLEPPKINMPHFKALLCECNWISKPWWPFYIRLYLSEYGCFASTALSPKLWSQIEKKGNHLLCRESMSKSSIIQNYLVEFHLKKYNRECTVSY